MLFWRSVVGKLWFTILLLVSVVLITLTILLLQYFDRFHTDQAEEELMNHASLIVSVLENEETEDMGRAMSQTISETYGTNALIIADEDDSWYLSDEGGLFLPESVFFEDEELSAVINDRDPVVTVGDYTEDNADNEAMIVGQPFTFSDNQEGSLYLYQSLDVVDEAADQTTNIILLSAGIAIVLTTVFAFFLTSRVTAPLRKMRHASLQVAKGNFDTKVPILTNDEIGLLAIAFNRMARALNTNLTALNQEKEQLSRILSSMADGVITLDREGGVMVTNPPANEFISAWLYEQGYDAEESGQLPAELQYLFQQVVSEEKEQMGEVDVQGRTWAMLMSPLHDQEHIRGAVAVLRDMTEERLHDKLRKDFLANVSHELRTPISMLQGYSEAIVDDVVESDEEKRELAQIIHDESLRIGRLVNELLDIARMEAGHIQLNYEELDMTEFAERILRKFQGVAKEHDVELIGDIQPSEYKLNADSDRMEQVLTNLTDNAIRHTSENGSVTLRVLPENAGVRIDIEDTGAGINEEDLPFVFERFYKADKARTRGNTGTGLGLAIVKNIVQAHGGKVSAHSKVGEGTTFSVWIPDNEDLN
ncbi:ATP-binding protein [Salisediminibacterium halotolerans]|uniref:ATP-binding protein n=1 Tax=Salisediminibacterium halotolerans TaxID=517425 RepID=UPI000EB29A9C|nr:ATP-binding protein [Salisediminibacterium halotolerans]RLJ77985.1 two-component system sensor histidine kinase ResE [Actinophytocola xinjiangensis]RPE88677.1 two-component system sensor histidine kinase ResE [Salisediminibacterium halotolerans]TWG36962.1 two-component system sensor histidine kinase ResE [Salisediminibacterium halotolerans]GEL08425.1 sensor histidine kinase ResE [Salisediminibacterium halotolerans]